MKLALPRLTFRMHDNPLLDNTDAVIMVLQQERLPTRDYSRFRQHLSWGHQQYNLLLQTLRTHCKELQAQGVPFFYLQVPKAQLDQVYQDLAETCDAVVTDYMTDPIYNEMDQAMTRALSPVFKSTFTLLDWRQTLHKEVLKKYYSKAKPFSKLTPLKEHVTNHVGSTFNSHIKGSDFQLPAGLVKYSVDIETELKNHQAEMKIMDLNVHNFDMTERQLLEYAKKCISMIGGDTWYKPDTAIGLNWDCKTAMKDKNTSQLSPFLSIGSLSVKFFWVTIGTSNTKMGSARDQLLFRECFNATAAATEMGLTVRTSEFWSDSDDSKFVDPKARDYPWKRDKGTIMEWQQGKMSPEGKDANESMQQLWKNGWIHHLRRHLVADVLARGKLHQHWTEGMYWFRYTLLDHDAAVNRANWMWLAAVAFSSKQKVYHYGWKDYVQRGTPSNLKPTKRNRTNRVKVTIKPVKPVKRTNPK